jgi:hypothetical protein
LISLTNFFVSVFQELLNQAKGSSGYDVSAALDILTDYLISDDGDPLLQDLAEKIVSAADSVGAESIEYILKASGALAINDEVAAIRAFRSLQALLQNDKSFESNIKEVLPKPTPSMERIGRIMGLLDLSSETDASKFVPIIRKLAQEPKVQRTSSEVVAMMGERVLSRSLRAMFGLPPPKFDGRSQSASTVFEENISSQ